VNCRAMRIMKPPFGGYYVRLTVRICERHRGSGGYRWTIERRFKSESKQNLRIGVEQSRLQFGILTVRDAEAQAPYQ
jgi:hypothetical protein